MQQQLFRSVSGDLICLKISIKDTKSLVFEAPLDWKLDKIKLLLVSKIPSLNFDRFHLTHHNLLLPGNKTLLQVINYDDQQSCRQFSEYNLTLVIDQQQSNQFNKLYRIKLRKLFRSFRGSFFQPMLNQNYQSVVDLLQISQLLQKKSISNLRRQIFRLKSLKQISQQKMNEVRAQNGQGRDLRNERQEDNRMMQMFMQGLTMLQMFCFGYIIGILLFQMDYWHYVVLLLILSLAGCIQIMRRISLRPRTIPLPNYQKISLKKSQKEHTIKQAKQRERLIKAVKIWCISSVSLVFEIFLSFMLSLFPNWTMQIHLNFFRITYLKIQRKIDFLKIQPQQQKNSSCKSALEDSPSQ